jgi:polar amino acid transport system substrate-binding protein
MEMTRTLLGMACVAFAASCASLDGPSPEERQSIAPSGKLRVALLEGSPVHLVGDARSTEAKGVSHDLGKALAVDLGVEFEPVTYQVIGAMLEGGRTAQWDVAFVGITPERAKFLDFTGRHMALEFGYLVPPGSGIASMEDVDRAGVRIAVVEKATAEIFLAGVLRQAHMVRTPTVPAAIELVRAGKADVFVGIKANLFDVVNRYPGARILEGSPGGEVQALALPKGRERAAEYSRGFVERAKARGWVQAAIDRAGVRGAVVPR